jgi:hypothetical protein
LKIIKTRQGINNQTENFKLETSTGEIKKKEKKKG